jgi:hypothetical protein
MMNLNLGEILRGIFSAPTPKSPMTEDNDDSEIRWEKLLANRRLQRARELQIDVDLEKRNQN